MQRRTTRLVLASAPLLLAACMHAPTIENYEATYPQPMEPPATGSGAIYQSGYDVALFENPVARRVGDIVTIRLEEATNASKSSATTTKKASGLNLPAPTLLGRGVTVNGTPILSNNVASDSSFNGAGDSKQSNNLQGDITVTVARRLANGNLLVRGQKWVGINQGKEYVRIQGVVRPIDIQPDNSISSTKVADASISYGGQGAIANSNSMGWLYRFFNSPLNPF